MRKRAYIGVTVGLRAFDALFELAKRNNVTVTAYIRAIITDALVEEGFDGIQFLGAPGRPRGRKASTPSRDAELGDSNHSNGLSPRQAVGT